MSEQTVLNPAQIEAFNRLKDLVKTCPRGFLVRLFEEFNGVAFPEVEEVRIRERVSLLKGWAALGSKDAVESLAGIASDISDFLELLAGDSRGSGGDIGDDTEDPWIQSPSWSDEETLARMARDIVIVAQASDKGLRAIFKIIDEGIKHRLLVPTATGMFTDALGRLLKCEDRASEDGGKAAEGGGTENRAEDQPEEDGSGQGDWDATVCNLDLIFSRLLGMRARHLGRAAARSVIAEAETWPLVVAAPSVEAAESVDKRIVRIGLGTGLSHRIPRPKSGNEDIRRWVTSIFRVLEHERVWMAARSESHRAEIQAAEDAINSGKEEAKPPLSQWNTLNHWRRKAALLPLLDESSVGRWVDAAMAYLKFLASRECYRADVRKPLRLERDASRSPLVCPGCGKSLLGECACPIGREISDEDKIKLRNYAELEKNLLEKWEKGVGKRFDHYPWPEFITRRTEKRPNEDMRAPSALREKLTQGFKAMPRSVPKTD